MRFKGKKCAVTGGVGFIGSRIVDQLIKEGAEVLIIDDLSHSNQDRINRKASLYHCNIVDFYNLAQLLQNVDYVFHTAAISRTPPCIDNPRICYEVNVMGTLNVLEAAKRNKVKRVVLSSSNVVYAFDTPYRTSKEALERLGDVYNKMYGQSVVSLCYSNVYGSGMRDDDIAVFQSLRHSKEENGYITITGDGEQSRDYTHVSDIVEGNLLAALSDYQGRIDLCTGHNTTMNEVARFFNCPVKYVADRPGDVKHIKQIPFKAREVLGWEYKVKLSDGIKEML